MTSQLIKNEQWYVCELIQKISNGDIKKPKFQRKKKWSILPKNKNTNKPNEKNYINFLFETHNTVHAITFGKEINNNNIEYQNIDGNNVKNDSINTI